MALGKIWVWEAGLCQVKLNSCLLRNNAAFFAEKSQGLFLSQLKVYSNWAGSWGGQMKEQMGVGRLKTYLVISSTGHMYRSPEESESTMIQGLTKLQAKSSLGHRPNFFSSSSVLGNPGERWRCLQWKINQWPTGGLQGSAPFGSREKIKFV